MSIVLTLVCIIIALCLPYIAVQWAIGFYREAKELEKREANKRKQSYNNKYLD